MAESLDLAAFLKIDHPPPDFVGDLINGDAMGGGSCSAGCASVSNITVMS